MPVGGGAGVRGMLPRAETQSRVKVISHWAKFDECQVLGTFQE